MFLEDPGLRFALNARPAASQGFAPAGAFQEHESAIFREDRISEFISKRIKTRRLRVQARIGPGGAKSEHQKGPNQVDKSSC